MAMNKKEQQQMADLAHELRVAKAFYFTDLIAPDLQPPSGGSGERIAGWQFNAYNSRVQVACTTSSSHSLGRTDKTDSQRSIPLCSTKTRALKALRAVKEREFAKQLLAIDDEIEKVADEERTRSFL